MPQHQFSTCADPGEGSAGFGVELDLAAQCWGLRPVLSIEVQDVSLINASIAAPECMVEGVCVYVCRVI